MSKPVRCGCCHATLSPQEREVCDECLAIALGNLVPPDCDVDIVRRRVNSIVHARLLRNRRAEMRVAS